MLVEAPTIERTQEKKVRAALHSLKLADLALTPATAIDANEYLASNIDALGLLHRVQRRYGLPEGGQSCLNLVRLGSDQVLDSAEFTAAGAEADLVFARLVGSAAMDHPVTADLDDLRRVHAYLFHDLVSWAGEVREHELPIGPDAVERLPAVMIKEAATFAAIELQQNRSSGSSPEQFVRCLSVAYEGFNFIAPFRQGNGRALRLFLSRVAREAGWYLAWENLDKATLSSASAAASNDRDFAPLREALSVVVEPLQRVGRHVAQREDNLLLSKSHSHRPLGRHRF